MKKFIEELRNRGTIDRMVKACLIVNHVVGSGETPVEAIETMIEGELKEDEELMDVFLDECLDIAYRQIRDVVDEEVRKEEEKFQKKEDPLIRFFSDMNAALNNLNDDLK